MYLKMKNITIKFLTTIIKKILTYLNFSRFGPIINYFDNFDIFV